MSLRDALLLGVGALSALVLSRALGQWSARSAVPIWTSARAANSGAKRRRKQLEVCCRGNEAQPAPLLARARAAPYTHVRARAAGWKRQVPDAHHRLRKLQRLPVSRMREGRLRAK